MIEGAILYGIATLFFLYATIKCMYSKDIVIAVLGTSLFFIGFIGCLFATLTEAGLIS